VLFPTIQFGIFFPIVFIGSWLLRPQPQRWKLFMIATSYLFYAFAFKGSWLPWDTGNRWKYPALLLLVTVINQVFVVGIFKARNDVTRKIWATVAVVSDLGVLAYFKYYNFGRDNFGPLLSWLPKRQVILPVAISFFIFQALSYVIDAYRGKVKPTQLIDFATYLCFFPHLVAGPIVRATEFLPQLRVRPDPRFIDASHAFRLIVAGMFKKVVISAYLSHSIADQVFTNPKGHSALETLFGIYAYALQIYADFSGYTDIAIGIALLLGVRFPKNFDSPYTATSLQDFWRRWHMSLSRWLRDYLYIPLGGSRKGTARTYINLALTMLIGGLWHGAAWRFVIWGGIHGVGLAVERFMNQARGISDDAPIERGFLPKRLVGWVVTFHIVCFAWVFFRAEKLSLAYDVLGRLVSGWGSPSPLVTPLLGAVLAIMIFSQFVPEGFMKMVQFRFSTMPVVFQGLTLAICFFFIDRLAPIGVQPFIYFQF
jgi:alginate O-acetyltransferase complex protein AlgI